MTAKAKITDKGKRAFDDLRLNLNKEMRIKVGLLGPDAQQAHPGGSGLTVVEIGLLHDMGIGVPQRPWLRGWNDINKAAITRRIIKTTQRAYLGKGPRLGPAADKLGRGLRNDLRRSMQFVPPPLADSTVARKGHARTMLESRALLKAVTYSVRLVTRIRNT